MKICCICSGSGHLTELMQIESSFKDFEHFFVCFKRQNSIELSKTKKMYFIVDTARNPLKFLWNFFQSLRIFLKEKPDIVLSTGAGMAIAMCYIAKLFGKKIIFIESFCRIKMPSASAKIVYPIADLFFVQWKQNKKIFPKAKYFGGVL